MKTIRKLKCPITIFLLILIISYFVYSKSNLEKNKYKDIEIVSNIEKEEQPEESKDEIIKYNVDIKGAVKKPGVYLVDNNLTVNDVINLAGGLNKDADTSLINLAKKITDEMVIIIYTKEEVKNSNIVDTVIKVVEKECVCPNIENDSCINTEIKDDITNTENNSCINTEIKDDITNTENNKLVNINTATKEELQTINGIGESKANNIIKYREEVGNFKTIADLKNVDGIGDNLYESIKIYITT